jgi:hypothetical protein
MKIKTESGVSISFIPEGSSRIILFDKPVRVIELKKEEISQMSAALLASSIEIKDDAKSQSKHDAKQKVRKASR